MKIMALFQTLTIVFSVKYLSFSYCNNIANLGEPCSTPSKLGGLCRFAEDCYNNKTELKPAICFGANVICCPLSGKSEKMCSKYSDAVYQEDDVIASLPGRNVKKKSECGIAGVPLIIGGEKASMMEFPHMVVIGYGKRETASWSCGGSLISERFVLTAGHCTKQQGKGPAKWVLMGLLNMKEKDESESQEYEVTKIIRHPRFKPPGMSNDLALLGLNNDVMFTAFVRPACLNIKFDLMTKTAIATGWGTTKYAMSVGSPDLMKVQLDIIKKEDCTIFLKSSMGTVSFPFGIEPSMICGGKMEGGKDTCQGDSGGPLQTVLENPYCMYNIYGVTSFGKFCGFQNSPAIYTNIAYFVPWIESIVWN